MQEVSRMSYGDRIGSKRPEVMVDFRSTGMGVWLWDGDKGIEEEERPEIKGKGKSLLLGGDPVIKGIKETPLANQDFSFPFCAPGGTQALAHAKHMLYH